MLKIHKFKELSGSQIQGLTSRNTDEDNTIEDRVLSILSEVKLNGDKALLSFADKFDGVKLNRVFINKEEISSIAQTIGECETHFRWIQGRIDKLTQV